MDEGELCEHNLVRKLAAFLVSNRGDAWTAPPRLLADLLTRADRKSLEYALSAIGGSVRRPLAHLKRTLQNAVASGRQTAERVLQPVRRHRRWQRPASMPRWLPRTGIGHEALGQLPSAPRARHSVLTPCGFWPMVNPGDITGWI